MDFEIILYCSDQLASKDFYCKVLNLEPVLDVPGMTEFQLAENLKLGLMPEKGIAKILGDKMPHPSGGNGIPRAELYLLCDDINVYWERAIAAGALLIDEAADRDWGHRVAYVSDPDGHVLAFAQKLS